MALYLGSSEKLKINIGNAVCRVNVFNPHQIIQSIRLLSSDGYMLKDSNGLYLTSKEDK